MTEATTEATDDLSAPLGQQAHARPRRHFPVFPVLAGLLGLFLAVFLGFALFGDGRLGGEPSTRVAISRPLAPTISATEQPASPSPAPAAPAATAPDGAQRTVTIIDGSSGERKSVVIPGDGGAAVPEAALKPQSAPADGADPRLLEKSRHGLLPVAAGGMTPLQAYAAGSDQDRAAAAGSPHIAIVVGGLGVSTSRTSDAVARLPPAVTLGFTPYGTDIEKLVAQARAAKHEILLQVPMEPFDYPDNDSGPQALLTTLRPEQNLDRLHWHMGRFQGYVGLAAFMGARMVANETALQPVIKDAAKRGLGYFDDGRAARSVAQRLAGNEALPFAKADIVLDALPAAGEIDQSLARLEKLAHERGRAIGTATLSPVLIDRIAAWAATLEKRGVRLVPLTTIMLKSKSS